MERLNAQIIASFSKIYQTHRAGFSHKIAMHNKNVKVLFDGSSVENGSVAIYNQQKIRITGYLRMLQEDAACFSSQSGPNKRASVMRNYEEVGHGLQNQVVLYSAES